MTAPVHVLGFRTLKLLEELGQFGVFVLNLFVAAFSRPLRLRRILDEIYTTGVRSLAIVCTSGLAIGLVMGLQGYNTLSRFGAADSLGAVVGLTLVRELGPVLTALLVTGRAGSAVAAGIGAMVATEQLNGLRMMSIDPIHYVAMPKALSLLVSLPLLSALFIVFGLMGGYLIGVVVLGIDGGSYLTSLEYAITFSDSILVSLIKAVVFGLIIGLISTFRGYTSDPSSDGVSQATTGAMVQASVATLIMDYFITALWGV